MIDTFKPLKIVKKANDVEDENYMYTWVQKNQSRGLAVWIDSFFEWKGMLLKK